MPGVGSDFSAGEMGFPTAPPPPPGNSPPGGGGATTPHFLNFASLIQTASRSYRWIVDESLRMNPNDALAMRRDIVLHKALRARQRPTAQLEWNLEPRDETDPAEVESAALVTEIIENIPRFQDLKMHMLEALWYGKYAVEVEYQWETWYNRQVMTVRNHVPIMGDKIYQRWNGQNGILVSSLYPGTKEPVDRGMAHFLTPQEREQYIIHHFEPEDMDFYDGEMAGAIQGVGLRGRLYWFWWLKQQVFALMMNYLERFSNGLTIFYYDAHNPQAKEEAVAAAKQQFSSTALLYPRWIMGNSSPNGVERLEVGTASPTLLWNLVSEYFDPTMTQAIVGQSLSSDHTGSGGLGGGGVAEFQSETLDEIIKYDAVALGQTIQTDLVNVLYRWNCPNVRPGKFGFQVDAPNSKEILDYAQTLFEMGMGLDEDELYELGQLSKPKPGAGVVSKIGMMQSAAIASMPQGVPMAGSAGPQDASGGAIPSQSASQPVPGDLTGQATPAMAFGRNGKSRLRSSIARQPVKRRRLPQRTVTQVES